MSNLRAEKRRDVTGKVVTRHVRDEHPTSAASQKALLGAKPTTAKQSSPFRSHFSEFDVQSAYRSDYTPPTSTEVRDGTTRTTTGSKFQGNRDISDIKKDVDRDLKEAVDAGYLPDGMKIRLRTSRAARVQSLSARIEGMPDSAIYTGQKNEWGGPEYSELANTVLERVQAIVGAYDRSYSDWQSDGGGNVYYSGAAIVDEEQAEFELQQAANKRRARENRIEQNVA